MGCTQSKIENEEAVSRCKERKQFMKEAVTTRNAFAAAQSAYTMALKNTGAALSDYGQGEVEGFHQPHSNHHHHQSTTQSSFDNLPPPPPPLPNFSPAPPLKRASTMPEFVLPKPDFKQNDPIQEDDEDGPRKVA
ncbi:DNA ligase (DUF630 and DUF632) [Thalictrum thalictroides]|uniref:DNA ligase (DUF630 and DUF632) n=1 Tax=Thalictrum thalictroides TaxID=46969 RepID=A0A7J6VZ03_THATH|nr:DNA ligase (DUF630 and DUF632) [Thalictrum thalictroides]